MAAYGAHIDPRPKTQGTPSFREVLLETLTKHALLLSIVFFGLNLLVRIIYQINAPGIGIAEDELFGGDYLAFWTAGQAFWAGDAVSIYDRDYFEASLSAHSGLDQHYMMWQYPPTAFFIFSPLGLWGFFASYWGWMAITFALLALALRSTSLTWRETVILCCAALTPYVMSAGQSGFLTTALMIWAVFSVQARPLKAGLAAGLLTFKPQLGVLIPVAYAVMGAWRAFAVASAVTVLLVLASFYVFGVEAWTAFFSSIGRIYTDYISDGGATPPKHMTTLMSQLRLWSVDQSIASVIHYGFAAALIIMNAAVWRLVVSNELRAGLLCASSVLLTPYAYNYELIVLVAPVAALLIAARKTGWLKYEREALIMGWAIAAFYGVSGLTDIIQFPFYLTLGAIALLMRRIKLHVLDVTAVSKTDQYLRFIVTGHLNNEQPLGRA